MAIRLPRAGLALLVVLGLGAGARPLQVQGERALLARTHCSFTIGSGLVEGRDVSCGMVTVPEDHAHPNGKTIGIPYALFTSRSAKRAPDPVFSLQGGPGGAWITILGPEISAATESLFVGDRDLVLIDQRGTGLAKPSLTCSPLAAKTADPLKHTTVEQDVALSLTIATQCTAELIHRGIDLGVYTTSQDAADIDAVRAAMGYDQINLYGVSYGTELVQVLMRDFPQHIRSAVLDSVVPVENSIFVDGTSNPAHGLKQLFAGCVASPACNTAYPNLEATFYQTVRRLDAHPVAIRGLDISTGKPVNDPYTGKPARGLLTGQEFQNLITEAEYESTLIPILPAAIVVTSLGQYKIDELLEGDSIAVQKAITTAMYYSVTCSEDAPFTTAAQIIRAASTVAPELRHYTLVSALGDLTLCRNWPVQPVPTSFKRPLYSSIPTLLLEGAYDPITPLPNARKVASTLRTAYLYSFPGYGHGELGSGPCPSQIVQSFLDSPRAKPDARCLATLMPPKFFVPGG